MISIYSFNDYFEVVSALSEELKLESYKLRHQVFKIEKGFNLGGSGNELESDEFDTRSVHYLIKHRGSGTYAATVRFVLPEQDTPFPVEQYCEIDDVKLIPTIGRNNIGELSRLCISKNFKNENTDSHFSATEKRVFEYMSLVLMACATRACVENNLKYSLSSLEPSFFRLAKMMGIYHTKIGPLTEHCGKRFPVLINVEEMMTSLKNTNPNIFKLFSGEIVPIGGFNCGV